MKGFLYSGLILIIIFVMIFALMSLSNYYDYLANKIYYKYSADNIYQTSLDGARLLSYAKQNIIQDALSDSMALATELSLNSGVSNYTYVVANLSLPNNISGIRSLVYLDDGFPVSCYYKANYIFYIPKFWSLGFYPYYPKWSNNITNPTYKVMGLYTSNQNTTRNVPLTEGKYTLKLKFCYINSGSLRIYLNNQTIYYNKYYGNSTLKCKNINVPFAINKKDFYNITVESTATQWGIDQISLEKTDNLVNNLFIYNISKIICIGNDFLSTQVLLCEKYDNNTKTTYNKIIYNYWAYPNWTGSNFVGCENFKILNTSEFINLTNYKNYTWYYLIRNKNLFKEFLINKVLNVSGNDLSNLSLVVSDPKTFTFSGNYSIDRSKALDNPNYDYLKYVLNYSMYSSGEFGGITGTGFDNLSCSNENNYNSNINCEAEPFISNYSSDYYIEKPIQIPLKVCKKLSENNYGLITSTLKEYAKNVFQELLFKTKHKKDIEVLDVFVKNYPVNCINITKDQGFNFTIDICVKYKVISSPFEKINTVCSKRTLWFDFHKNTFGDDASITTPKGKYAYRVFYKQPNILYLPNATYYEDSYKAKYNCSIICRENITGIKYSGERIFYSDIKVIDILRSGIDPDNYLFEHPFHILTTSYKKSQVYSICDSIKYLTDAGKSCNDIPELLKEEFIYLNDSADNIKTDIVKLTNTSFLLEINVSDNLYPEIASDIRYGW